MPWNLIARHVGNRARNESRERNGCRALPIFRIERRVQFISDPARRISKDIVARAITKAFSICGSCWLFIDTWLSVGRRARARHACNEP